jgi:nicotinamidase-related amidase
MKTALLLIDIQNDYFPGGKMELVGTLQAAAAAARLLATFRKQSWLVYHVQHISTRPSSTFFLPGTTGIEIFPSVAPLPNEPVVTKHFPNCFRETDLEETLRRDEVDRILVCGMMTSMCVDATVRAAFDLGFSCTVAQDACATRDLSFEGVTIPARQVHGAFLSALGTVYANIKPTDVILDNIASGDH